MGIAAPNGLIGDYVGQEHSGVEGDDIGTRWNAFCPEPSPGAIVIDTVTGFPFFGNQEQFAAAVARNAIPHWHAAIMLRQLAQALM